MTDLFGFRPDARRAVLLDQYVRLRLAASLESIFGSISELRVDANRLGSLLTTIRTYRVRPGLFGIYTDLVECLLADDLVTARQLVESLSGARSWVAGSIRVASFDEDGLGHGQPDRYRRLIDDDNQLLTIMRLNDVQQAQAVEAVASAMQLLDGAAPEVAGEIRGLINEFVPVDGSADDEGSNFEGGSSLYLWGAMVLNFASPGSRLKTALSIVHEATHSHLFGVLMGERLVENADDERYPSPLRHDSRPMEGIVHATYVLARLFFVLPRLIASGLLDEAEIMEAESALRNSQESYKAGLQTIQAHAAFAPEGGEVFGNAQAYMSDALN